MEDSYSKDSFTNLTDGLLLLMEQGPPSTILFLLADLHY